MNIRLIPLAAAIALLLAACQETPSATAEDVAVAQQGASKESAAARDDASEQVAVADADVAKAQRDYAQANATARKKLTEAESAAMIETANADYDVAIVDAEGRDRVARERCDALSGVAKEACLSTADATLAAEKSAATAKRDQELVDAAYHD
jgi:hypothetical protein